MEETWRWFGPDDPVRLPEIRQAGARGIVTALHQIPYGVVWTVEAIRERQATIAADDALGLEWRVVESLPVHEAIKRGDPARTGLFDTYRQSLRNLAACGIRTVCYNYMPVLDWTRTDLAAPVPGGGRGLRFDAVLHAAFDCYLLRRPGAEEGVDPAVLDKARAWVAATTPADHDRLLSVIMAGLPGAFDRYDLPGLRNALAAYAGLSADDLRATLREFLQAVVPTAAEHGIRLCIHPDDPPRPLFGLPRIVSTEDDIAAILGMVDDRANGLTFCTGSLAASPTNDPVAIARRFADRIHFAHLRNVAKEPDGSFAESGHVDGDVPMPAVVRVLMAEERRRLAEGRADAVIPFRPDHGHELLDDPGRGTHPGYPLVGRLKGLAEIRGIAAAVAMIEGAA